MTEAARNLTDSLQFTGALTAPYQQLLTPEVNAFITSLAEHFTHRRDTLLQKRIKRQERLNVGELPDFLPETKGIREADWKVAAIPEALQDRRVEITGPVERKMIINALNSGAKVFMADFEDSLSPTWESVMDGQINLQDYANGTISYQSPEGKNISWVKKSPRSSCDRAAGIWMKNMCC